MRNSFFQFKQFIVHQDKVAMKVCTDACLFGAWVANEIQNTHSHIHTLLDVGTGSGLLSLMLAQKTNARIDSVEIDHGTYEQAKDNFKASPWNDRLNAHHTSVQQFSKMTTKKFEVIISNPPFYENSLKSNDTQKNIAKHAVDLSFKDLCSTVFAMLHHEGNFYVLLPYEVFAVFNGIAVANKLFLKDRVNVKQTGMHEYFRTMCFYSKIPTTNKHGQEITINLNNEYTPAFKELLKDYYLHL